MTRLVKIQWSSAIFDCVLIHDNIFYKYSNYLYKIKINAYFYIHVHGIFVKQKTTKLFTFSVFTYF